MGVGQLVHDVHPKHITTFSPGRQGTIGGILLRPRFRQSTPDMAWAYDPYWTTARTNKLGSNIQDGSTTSYDTGYGPPRLDNQRWIGNRSLRHQYGRSFHDLPDMIDKSTLPADNWQGDVSWKRKLAATAIAKRSGNLFLVKPKPFVPTGPTRGGNYPTSTTIGGIEPAGGEAPIDSAEHQEAVNAGITSYGLDNNKQVRLDRFVTQTRGQLGNMRIR